VPHIVIIVICLLAMAHPPLVHAGTLATITEKFKAIFATEKVENEETLATSQTMALFKPVIVDNTSSSVDQDPEQDSLQAVSGPLRVSTEDIDFPTTDTVSVYEVKKGDTLQDVAKLFDVSVNTIIWANNLKSRTISKGDTLIILPITGIKHTVKKGDTIATIAKKYRADGDDVASYNGLAVNAVLDIGDTVIVPDGEIEVIQPTKPKALASKKPRILNSYSYTAPNGFLVRPISGGRKSQGIHGHNGIDLASSIGTPVVAAATGRVIVAKSGGYNGGYGSMVIISHDKGVQTVYGHLNAVYVSQGQSVSQGDVIGELGNTGKSTGPHLHFEVRGAKNPF
jgi:murein DD-endopeptidase MepM/ murein hydrolase activator NlpD